MKKEKSGFGATFFSGLCVLAALVLLVGVCGHCYPTLWQELEDVFAGMENGPVRQAFSTLTEGMENGESVRETLAQTAQVFLHEKG